MILDHYLELLNDNDEIGIDESQTHSFLCLLIIC